MNKLEFNIAFGKFLKVKRNQKSWSQTDLASELGNNAQNISRIERGELTPTIFWLQKLAKAFDCCASQLLLEFEENVNNEEVKIGK
jgi:ribosome-binding protein aMBF1 (putative translation factor)